MTAYTTCKCSRTPAVLGTRTVAWSRDLHPLQIGHTHCVRDIVTAVITSNLFSDYINEVKQLLISTSLHEEEAEKKEDEGET